MDTGGSIATTRAVTLHVIGPVAVTGSDGQKVHLSSAVAQVMAVLAAAGPSGVTKDDLAEQLWHEPLPPSWKSAVRNRITRARSALGAGSILNVSNRYRLAGNVQIDSLQLLSETTTVDTVESPRLDSLQGAPLAGVVASPLIVEFRERIRSARASLVREMVRSPGIALSHRHLAALRRYVADCFYEPGVTADVVRAHLQADELVSARQIVHDARHAASKAGMADPAIDDLSQILGGGGIVDEPTSSHPDDVASAGGASEKRLDESRRAELFWAAARDEQWTLAYEIATEGVARTASAGGGASDRWPMQMAIPLDQLDPARQLRLAAGMAWQMRVSNPDQALQWARVASDLACSQDQDSLADVAAALTGDVADEHALLTLPAAMVDPTVDASDMHGYQVVLVNHLERSSWPTVAPLARRFHDLVDASPEPYRRWHGMNLRGMHSLVEGDWQAAQRHAKQSYGYGEFSGLAEAPLAWNCHLLNQHWIFDRAEKPAVGTQFLDGDQTVIERGLASLASGDSIVVERFLENFDIESRMTFTVPMLVALAANATSTSLREALYQRLLKRCGTSAIFGAGMMHLGPVDRMCARLAEAASDKRLHLHAAITVADEQQTRLWQVICRRELAAITGQTQLADEAADLATTPVLRELAGLAPGGA